MTFFFYFFLFAYSRSGNVLPSLAFLESELPSNSSQVDSCYSPLNTHVNHQRAAGSPEAPSCWPWTYSYCRYPASDCCSRRRFEVRRYRPESWWTLNRCLTRTSESCRSVCHRLVFSCCIQQTKCLICKQKQSQNKVYIIYISIAFFHFIGVLYWCSL